MRKSWFLPGSPNDMINHYFPEKTARMQCDDKLFIAVKIKGLLKKRDNAYKHVSWEIRKAKKTYYIKHYGGHNRNGDARTCWKKVWKLTEKNRTHINLCEHGADVIINDKDAASMMNSFFADRKTFQKFNRNGHLTVNWILYLLSHLKSCKHF